MPGGRPRELPSRLPRLDPAVALDPSLQGIELQSSAFILPETRRRHRQEKQAETARRLATQRARRQVEELARACQHARLSAEKSRQRFERLAAKQAEEAQRLDQLRLRVEAGEEIELSDGDARKLRRVAGFGTKKSRLSETDHRVIQELGTFGGQMLVDKSNDARNSDRAIEERFKYASFLPTKFGQNTLYEAIYYDEMKLTRQTNRKAWSIAGWIPTVPDEFYTDHPEHVSLLLAGSPSFGVLHFEVVEGSITAEVILDFMKEMMTRYMDKVPAARRQKPASVTDESRAMLKKKLSEVVVRITEHDVRQFYFHVEHFIRYALDKTPVFTQQLYENSHSGDEVGYSPMLPDTIETLFASYLPQTYEEFAPEMNRDIEHVFGVRRLTMEVIQ
ncbi:Hypothetical protein PHPALM_18645, partial [Phytophthora palmivora]